MSPTVSPIQPAIRPSAPPDVWIPFCPSCFPIHLSDCVYDTSKGTLRSSSQYPLATPKARLKTCGERKFVVAAPQIPLGIRSSSSINSFKRHLKTYPLKQAYNFFQFFFVINLFNYLRSFKLVYSYIRIYFFSFPFFLLAF